MASRNPIILSPSNVPFILDNLPVLNYIRYFLAIISIFGNGWFIFIALRFSKFRKSQCNQLIAIQSFADFLIGIGYFSRATQATLALSNGILVFNKTTCSYLALIQGIGTFSQQLTVLALALDRLWAVAFPTKYYNMSSKPLCFLTLLGCILVCIGYFFVTFYGLNLFDETYNCSAGSSAGPYFRAYLMIFGVVCAVAIYISYILTVILLKFRLSTIKQSRIQIKVFTSISLVLLSYAIFWCLPLTFLILTMFNNFDNSTVGYITTGFGFGAALNSALNVFLYLFKHPDIQYFSKLILFSAGFRSFSLKESNKQNQNNNNNNNSPQNRRISIIY